MNDPSDRFYNAHSIDYGHNIYESAQYDDIHGACSDDIDVLLSEIANSSPSPPDRSQRLRSWGVPQYATQTQNRQSDTEPPDQDHNAVGGMYNRTSPVIYPPTLSHQFTMSNPTPILHHDAYSDRPGPQIAQGTRLRPVSDLPDIYRGLFKFGVFNAVQSQCYDTVMNSDENMVISAPTGSGKTVLFELAIVRMLKENSSIAQKCKCVYIAPTKSLCTEKATDWEVKFAPFGAKCSELTGDTVTSGRGAWGDAKDATIIVTTGEKWDSLTRNWQDHSHVLSQVHLFLIDEVHLLNETRGSTLEVVVSRMKLRAVSVRFVVVSATVPNIGDVADWVGDQLGIGPATVKEFGEDFRPCKLSKFVYGIPRRQETNDFVFAKALDYKLYSVLQQHCNNKPVLVFCPTRKGVLSAAEHIAKEYEDAIGKKESLPWSKPPRLEHTFGNKQLDKLAAYGIGIHHAGLRREDRAATEQLYLKKILKVLFATSTLAVGVNLPAHTVVIKGVKLFQNNESQEYSDLDVMQMIGRAGRPQFDKEGIAVIMCEQHLEAKYKALAQGRTILESSLHEHLPEHLNSEIALGTITSMDTAREWLRSTFLYRRLKKNPAHYRIKNEGGASWEERMDTMVRDSVGTLEAAEMVSRGEEAELYSTEYGDIMSKFYIRQATMVRILKLSDKASIREILEVLSCSEEFSDIKFRSGEKQVYNKLRTHHDIRYPIKKLEKPADKVFILIQAILSAVNLSDPEFKSADTQPYTEAIPILRHITRIARAVVEVANNRQAGALLKNALEVMRSLNAKAWEDRSVIFRQIDDIGLKSLKVLAEHNVTTFTALRKMDPARIELLLNRRPPFGHEVLAAVNQLPQYTVKVSELDLSTCKDGLEVELSIECGLVREMQVTPRKKTKKHKRGDMTMVLTLSSDQEFIDFRRIATSAFKQNKTFKVTAKLTKPSHSIIVYVSSDTFAGVTASASYKPDVTSSVFPIRDTRPQDALARDLEGLEDIPEFWELNDNDIRELQGSDTEEKMSLELLGKSKETAEPPDAVNHVLPYAAPRQLPNGNFECNHACKDKTKCRHLCCRDGLAKPPPMTKKRIESLAIAADALPSKSIITPTTSGRRDEGLDHRRKTKDEKAASKTKSKADHCLKQLEVLHERTGVQEHLQLGNRSRIKLDHEVDNIGLKRKRLPKPNFDMDFSRLGDRPTKPQPVIELSDSDDDLPDARDLLNGQSGQQGVRSDSTDYADSAFDALIADLPVDYDSVEGSFAKDSLPRTCEELTCNTASTCEKRKRHPHDSSPARPAKKRDVPPNGSSVKAFASPESAHSESPLFGFSLSDEGEVREPQIFKTTIRSSPATSCSLASAPVIDEDAEAFTLDTSLFDVVPATPNLSEASYAHVTLPRATHRSTDDQPKYTQERSTIPAGTPGPEIDLDDDPLAEFEAWLRSGAVVIVKGDNGQKVMQ